jgi:hypothetical protein
MLNEIMLGHSLSNIHMLPPNRFMLVVNLFNHEAQIRLSPNVILQSLWKLWSVKKHTSNRLRVMLAMCRDPFARVWTLWYIVSIISSYLKSFLIEDEVKHSRLIIWLWVGSPLWSFGPYPHRYLGQIKIKLNVCLVDVCAFKKQKHVSMMLTMHAQGES